MTDRPAFRIAILLLLVVLGAGLFIHYDLYSFFADKNKVIAFIHSYPHDEIVFISLQIMQVVAAPIPGEITGLIGGYLYGPVLGTLYSTVGLTVGSWLAFILARYFGLSLVEKVVKPETIQKYDYFMEHRGAFVSFLLFLIPGFPKDYLCYIMGVSHMKTWTFMVISTVGRFFGTMLLSVSGSCARNNQITVLVIIAVVSGIFVIVAYFYRDKWLDMLKSKKPEVKTED
ncbi:MAG: TVP38/TMEM64 family protein [Deltaproteobacteria bacterium]|nr:TVP38/TMEM64 family protein [Deltaproteobacteria bacterium]